MPSFLVDRIRLFMDQSQSSLKRSTTSMSCNAAGSEVSPIIPFLNYSIFGELTYLSVKCIHSARHEQRDFKRSQPLSFVSLK